MCCLSISVYIRPLCVCVHSMCVCACMHQYCVWSSRTPVCHNHTISPLPWQTSWHPFPPNKHTKHTCKELHTCTHAERHDGMWITHCCRNTCPRLYPHRRDCLFAMMGDTADWHFPPYQPNSQSTEIVWWHCWLSRHLVYGVCVVTVQWGFTGVSRCSLSVFMWMYGCLFVLCVCVTYPKVDAFQGHVTIRIKGIHLTLNQSFEWL